MFVGVRAYTCVSVLANVLAKWTRLEILMRLPSVRFSNESPKCISNISSQNRGATRDEVAGGEGEQEI